MSILYCDATLDDAAAIGAFCASTFVATFGHMYPPEDLDGFLAASYTPEKIAAELADPDVHYHLAWKDGALAGYCMSSKMKLVWDTEPGALELRRLYVSEDVKGAGVAQALMHEAITWARGRGAPAMYLSVWENNERAQRFYARFGFEHVGEHKFMVGSVADRDFIWRMAL